MQSSIPIILASGSPRRVEMLKSAGLQFEQVVADIVEERQTGEVVLDFVERLAREKAEKVAATYPDSAIIGADTVVASGDSILGKPVDAADAVKMLGLLSGTTHDVVSAYSIVHVSGGVCEVCASSTRVTFADLTKDQIERYVESGEPMDKAGAYAIQGIAAQFIERLDGSYTNVVGFDLCGLMKSLRRLQFI